ncbi:hypothetical protein EB796_024322 [Bugula neritina]|uniref:Uncharacterized protein n=1 Tax=Bugula neritina TaxID=10212 RepID=A0A7J7IVW3_BUGNE|nr:hypothetical protein EB796_024322 [Bugula neritina]
MKGKLHTGLRGLSGRHTSYHTCHPVCPGHVTCNHHGGLTIWSHPSYLSLSTCAHLFCLRNLYVGVFCALSYIRSVPQSRTSSWSYWGSSTT